MAKLPTTPNNLKQPSPDTQGLDKMKPASLDKQAAEVNRDIPKLQEKSRSENDKAAASATIHKTK
jgi:hypothetical protein